MNKIYKCLTLGFVAISLSSCGDSWLNRDISDGVDSKKAIINVKTAEAALTGIYDGLQGSPSWTGYYATSMFVYGDTRGEDMQIDQAASRGADFYLMRYTLDDAPAIWSIPYTIIMRTNKLLEAIEANAIRDASVEQLQRYTSESLAIRALAHFDLCRVYGNPYNIDNGASLGITIVLNSLPYSSKEKRNTVAEVYQQVITDLEQSLSTGGLSDSKRYGYVNSWFVKGLLAKVNLYKGDYAKALAYAEQVIQKSPYVLWANEEYVSGWKTTSTGRKEMLFEIVNPSSSDWTDIEGIASLMNPKGYACIVATKAFITMLGSTPEDVRNGLFIKGLSQNSINQFGEDKVFVNKFPENASGEWRSNSLSILRLSEVYLIAAEAAAKLGKADVAANYLNIIHKRANPKAADITPAMATLERISLERRKELIGEGNRFFDAMRNNERITRYTSVNDRGYHTILDEESRSFDRTYFRTILPIPMSETNVNAPIRAQQNPGY